MLLSSIQVQGFKSFADKTVLKFGKGITAVVGPNGSGKSNISDAVRWVLGEQSTKSLRGQSMEDVIFSGTETRRPHGYCEVTLNINNTDRSLNFDNDFVSVTRRYYRSHESEYLINNVVVRLKDINELFMDTGLGRDGYSMIGQGKIDSIISSKSGERRDIFEEASGISKYRYRKIEAERRLKDAEENLLRLKDIMSELESRVGPLAQQSKKAEEFLKLAERKKELEIGLWLYTLDNSKDALRNQEGKIAAAQLKYQEIEKALEGFDEQAEKNSADFAKLTSDIEGERQNIARINEEIAVKSGNITVINNDISHNNESIERLKNEAQQLNNTDSAARDEILSKRNDAENKKAYEAELQSSLKEHEEQLAGLLSDSESISRKIEEQAKLLNTVSAQIADKRVEMVTAQTAVEEIKSRTENIAVTINQRKNEYTSLCKEFEETDKFLSETEDTITSCKNMLEGYSLKIASKQQAADSLKEKCDQIRLEIESKRRRIQLLSELESNMEGFNNAVKSVMEEAKKGVIRGICGPVSKIINVDKEYTVAIETALGGAIQNIVVETENDAKRAINYLKSANKGRATFLPVSSILARDFSDKDLEGLYGYVGNAADLVSVDAKYKEIVKYLLGGTVVAEDIDSAVTIAKKHNYRFKIVSLDGQVINPGGSLTGGSLIRNAGILSRSADIKRLTEEVEKLEKKLKATAAEFNEASSKKAEVEAEITAVQADLTNANEDKIRILGELRRIGELRDNTKTELDNLLTEKDVRNEKIEQLSVVSTLAAKEITSLDTKRAAVQAEIDSMSGGRDSISEKRNNFSEQITDIKLKIIENKKDIDALLSGALNLENMIGDRGRRIGEIESEISALNFKNQQLSADIDNANDDIYSLREEISSTEKRIEEFIEKRNSTEKFGIELRTSERERTLEREKIGGELARLCERKDVMLKEYDDVIRRLYDEYQLTRSEAEAIGIKVDKPTEAKKNLSEIKGKIRELGNVNVSAIEEYKEVSERYEFMSAQIADVENSRAELYKLINQLTSQMREMFNEGFVKINENFSKTFKDLFGGGSAELTLSNPEDVLESGIDINVKLPGKNVPSIDGLSGGEKALTALSIYFAIMRVNPPPFCFLDEVDTALDDINVDRFADYMKRADYATQFICVTHRRGTMEAADMLYGVTMQEKGITKLLELNVSELEKKLLENQGA